MELKSIYLFFFNYGEKSLWQDYFAAIASLYVDMPFCLRRGAAQSCPYACFLIARDRDSSSEREAEERIKGGINTRAAASARWWRCAVCCMMFSAGGGIFTLLRCPVTWRAVGERKPLRGLVTGKAAGI